MHKDPIDMRRRLLLAASLTTAATLRSKAAVAQELEIPRLEDTIDLLETDLGMALLLNRFSLLNFLLVEMHRTLTEEVVPPEEQVLYQRVVLELNLLQDEPGLRSELQFRLRAGADPLLADELERHIEILLRIRASLEELGINPESPVVEPALESLTHIERIGGTMGWFEGGICLSKPFDRFFFCSD